jgi:hypothetical protein
VWGSSSRLSISSLRNFSYMASSLNTWLPIGALCSLTPSFLGA